MSALKPTGLPRASFCVSRTPSRKSWPCTYVREIGWMMPIPPAAETAPTSSGLLHGYIAPQMIGSSIAASRQSSVRTAEQPGDRRPRHDFAVDVLHDRFDVVARLAGDGGN